MIAVMIVELTLTYYFWKICVRQSHEPGGSEYVLAV